jgi:hypothetical protein
MAVLPEFMEINLLEYMRIFGILAAQKSRLNPSGIVTPIVAAHTRSTAIHA